MRISQKGIELIKEFEGFKKDIYICPAGKKSIGYGHALTINENINIIGPISQEQAEILLYNDIKQVEEAINFLVKVSLRQGQFDALVSLVYNWGIGNFKHSKGLKLLNTSNYDETIKEFFGAENGVVSIKKEFSPGLYRRRQKELELWNLKD